MFHSRKRNHRINKIHECALRIVYNVHQCTFEELREWDNSFKIHERNLQKLNIEMFKVNNGLSLQLVKIFILQRIVIIFDINQEQNLRLIMLKLKHWQAVFIISRTWNLEFHTARNKKRYNFDSIQN